VTDARAALRAALLLAALAAVMTALVWADPVSPQNLEPIDTWWHDLVVPPGGVAHALARVMQVLGGDAVTFVVRAAVAVALAVRRRWTDLAAWLAAAIVADLLVGVLKTEVGRMRPDGSDLRSFPSGHAKAAAQTAIGLALLIAPIARRRSAVWAGAIAWIAGMAWSRTALDVHYLSDVIAGAAIGAAAASGAWGVARVYEDSASRASA
jgi:undecaprenyl-diphosphatase